MSSGPLIARGFKKEHKERDFEEERPRASKRERRIKRKILQAGKEYYDALARRAERARGPSGKALKYVKTFEELTEDRQYSYGVEAYKIEMSKLTAKKALYIKRMQEVEDTIEEVEEILSEITK